MVDDLLILHHADQTNALRLLVKANNPILAEQLSLPPIGKQD
jgi:hypothetical protein